MEQPPAAPALRARLGPPLAALGLALSPAQADLLARYLALLLPWNLRVNLTGARSAEAVLDHHMADAFAVAPQLSPGARRLADVGAGAGFLGVTLAVLRPELHCVLLEPVGKKHAFLRAVARELPLPNLEPRAERLAFHVEREGFELYDVAVSRATWPPLEWLERARALLRAGGLAVAFEGREPLALAPGLERVAYRFGERSGALLLRRA